MKKIIIISILVLTFLSCLPKKEPKITIENNTTTAFDSVNVYTNSNDPLTFYGLKESEKVIGNISFDTNKKNDGSYSVALYREGRLVRSQGFGYYTNGASLDREFNIAIMKDTIIIKSK